jgi:hypothetical protein
MKFNFIFCIIGLMLLPFFCGCDTPGALNATAIHRTDLLVKKVFNSEKITRAEGTFICEKKGRKSYILAIPVDTFVNPETLMISAATLNGELIIPQQSFDLKKGIR